MSNNWNIKALETADNIFNKLGLIEKLICSSLANCNLDLDFFQISWLIKDFAKKGLCHLDEITSLEEMQFKICSNLVSRHILEEKNNRYSVTDIYFHAAYRFPLFIDREKFSLSILNLASSSDFSFDFSYRQNSFSSLLMNLINGNIDNDIFSSFDFSFLNNTSGIPLFNKILEPFDESWFELLPEISQVFLLNYAIHYELITFNKIISQKDNDIFSYFMRPKWYKSEIFLNYASHNLALYLIFKGSFDRAKSYIELSKSIEASGINAFLVYLFHGSENAVNVYQESIKQIQKQKSKRNVTLFSLSEIFYFIALLQEGSSNSFYEAKKYIEKIDKLNLIFKPAYQILYEFYSSKIVGKYNRDRVVSFISAKNNSYFLRWVSCFVAYWIGINDKEVYENALIDIINQLKNNEIQLIIAETLNLAKVLNIQTIGDTYKTISEKWKENYTIPLIERIQQKQKWEFVLDELSNKLNLSLNNNEKSVRLIWDLKINLEDKSIKLFPKEQQKLKSGNWSIAKPIQLDNYYDDINPFPNYFSNQDKLIYKKLQHSKSWLNGNIEQDKSILPFLVNAPNVFINGYYDTPAEIIKGKPVLMLNEKEDGLYLKFQPNYENESVVFLEENKNRLRIFEFTQEQQQVAEIISENNVFPKSALEKIKSLLSSMSAIMPVHSNLDGTNNFTPIASIASSSYIYAQLEPYENGLKVSFCTKPFGPEGPSFVPGLGEDNVFAEISGQNLHTKRDLKIETNYFYSILDSCELIANELNEDFSIVFDSPELSLEFLLAIKDLPNLIIEWAENVKPKKVLSANFSNFSFKVKNTNDWFSLDGELRIDENHVIDLQKILKHYRQGSRFIQIDENQYLAITEEFRKKIEDIQAFTIEDSQQSLFHKSAIQIMDDILSDSSKTTFDRSWHEMLNHIKHASEKKFIVPQNFKAELRAYQVDGFNWLSRMAYLGMGACLADDMGLGKTVEALSIITARAALGPAFVLAPTSVCYNWFKECQRFSPTLNPILFAQSDRKSTIKNLAPNDLIICSYGVLQREIEDLAAINWSVVILDEAQAIKNMATNRSQAAMLLKGKFKMLMTGTPIENHLGELWNLFKFLNPGLLGSINTFNEKFAIPIQSMNDKLAQERLKRLVQPFILRRTKNQVLKDLPPRTEVILNVDLSQEEAELYESIRREAVENINKSKDNKQNTKPMIVLAEIMKLRRLCCNPSLIMPNLNIKSSKLALLENITEDLLASGHKALIFSQFVDHLSIIRKFFDEKGYKYQYLDGSTTIKARNIAINEFQNGNGDFFLISLKAGGQGINLTAADYVIHMDPWWNPAVEDQASDRAHRIGQTKPVTIYKLITTNTIEEKIVQLHGRKRDLADGLLEGTDITGKISTSELISLINNSAINYKN